MSGSQRRYPQITKAVYERPWAIMPERLAVIEEIVRLRVAGTPLTDDEIQSRLAAASSGPRNGAGQGQGVAVIPVYGVISHRMDLMSQISGGTSVQGLQRAFRGALADPEVGGIVFDIDSPGGSVEGIFEFAEEVFAARGQKPMASVANSTMASAAYLLGAQADEVIASPSSIVGSIGIIGMHVDVSAQDEMLGEKVTLITAGDGKADTNEHIPLSDDARAKLQSMADDYYGLFVKAVVAGRGVKASVVTDDWQASVFTARKAKTAGLADRVDTLDATVRRMVAKVNRGLVGNGFAGLFDAAAIGRHKTDTTEEAWDGPANEQRLPSGDGAAPTLRRAYAWVDDDGDPDVKASYKFIHHEVSAEGEPGAANLRACSSGISVLNGGRSGTTIPDSDRAGVHAHLAGHLTDAGREAPPLQGRAPGAVLPFSDRLAAAADEAAELVAHARERSRLRAKEGRPGVSEPNREQLIALAASLGSIQSELTAVLDTDEPEEGAPPSDPPDENAPGAKKLGLAVFEAAMAGGYRFSDAEVTQ